MASWALQTGNYTDSIGKEWIDQKTGEKIEESENEILEPENEILEPENEILEPENEILEPENEILEQDNEIWEANKDISKTDKDTREKMKRYWNVYKPSLESMMLSHDAKYLAENEQNEILSYLPPCKDQKILELGAGIGRFTTRLAQISGYLTAVDFMKSYIEENEKVNKHFGNVIFLCADVTKLDFPYESFDIVFSNWLLMYLSDAEVEKLMNKVLKWLKPNGFFFFRESCYHPSGNVSRSENPTKYRTPIDYVKLLERSSMDKMNYEMIFAKSVSTYVRSHGNPNQLAILAKQVKNTKNDLKKCNRDLIKFSTEKEMIFLKYQVSQSEDFFKDIVGGEETLKNVAAKLTLRSGQRVLSIDCGTGGVPVYLVKNYGVFVHGVDENITNIHIAIERQGKLELDVRRKIQFEFTSLYEAKLPKETYELALCLSLQHQHRESIALISRAKEWLQPGGHFVFTALIKTDLEDFHDAKEYLCQKEIDEEFQSSNFIVKEAKSDRDMAIRWFKRSILLNESDKIKIEKKIDLLEKKKLNWIKVIAMTCDAIN